jgi:hypothetical protein
MNANELMIGNYVAYKRDQRIFKVVEIQQHGIEVEDELKTTYMEYDEFQPIPLTEDWFIEFMFIKRNLLDMIAFYSNGIKVDLNNDNVFRYQMANYKILVLEYVHQLQNLNFALTGNPLTINNA